MKKFLFLSILISAISGFAATEVVVQDNEPLVRAINSKKLENVRRELEKFSINGRNRRIGFTPLTLCIIYNDFDMVKFCIDNGADVNLTDVNKDTPLIHAAQRKNMDIINLLILHGANLHQKSARGLTPLKVARQYGCIGLENIILAELKKETDAMQALVADPTNLDGTLRRRNTGFAQTMHQLMHHQDSNIKF